MDCLYSGKEAQTTLINFSNKSGRLPYVKKVNRDARSNRLAFSFVLFIKSPFWSFQFFGNLKFIKEI